MKNNKEKENKERNSEMITNEKQLNITKNGETLLTIDMDEGFIKDGKYLDTAPGSKIFYYRFFGETFMAAVECVDVENLSEKDFDRYLANFHWPRWANEIEALHPDITDEELTENIISIAKYAWNAYWSIRNSGRRN